MEPKPLTICFISLCVVVELTLLWLGCRYYFRDPERKAKRQETESKPIFIIIWGIIVFLALPVYGVILSIGLLRGEGGLWVLLFPLLLFRVGLYGCRWMLYYDREGFRLRRSYGKTRHYSYGDVKTIFPLFMGLLSDAMGQAGAVLVMAVGVLYLFTYIKQLKTA